MEISVHVFFTTMQPNITVGHIGSPKQKRIEKIKRIYVNRKKVNFRSESQVKCLGYHFRTKS